jgi:hypothetical protein
MGSDKAEKKRLKLEKKRLKAQAKLEKARAKAAEEKDEPASLPGEAQQEPKNVAIQVPSQEPVEKVPWYTNPDWVRAIAAIASLIVAVVAIVLTFY